MYSNTTEKSKMDINVKNLQYIIDKVSEAGGGLITIKAGNYYMTAGGSCIDSSTKRTKHYCIYPKDNVTIAGTRGLDGDLLTTFLPYGAEDNGITMFLFDSRASNNSRLTNSDFRDFRIDGINAKHTGKQEDIADRIEDLKNNYKNDTVRELLSISGQMVEI